MAQNGIGTVKTKITEKESWLVEKTMKINIHDTVDDNHITSVRREKVNSSKVQSARTLKAPMP